MTTFLESECYVCPRLGAEEALGRLRRLGQVRAEVSFTTVVMEHSLLHLLHQRHSSVDSMTHPQICIVNEGVAICPAYVISFKT